MRLLLTLAVSAGFASAALAQDAAPLGYDPPSADAVANANANGVVALSAEERQATLNAAAQREHDLPINGAGRKIHGEVGMAMGTGGYHSLYGTAVIPLGDTSTAVISMATSGSNGYYRRR